MSYLSEVLADNPVAYYRMDEEAPFSIPILDSFDRANQNPISGGALGWAGPMGGGDFGFAELIIDSNTLAQNHSGSSGSYTTTSLGPDVELSAKLTSGTLALASGIYLWCRVQNPDTGSFQAYGIIYYRYSGGEYALVLVVDTDGVDTTLSYIFNEAPLPLADGDSIGIRCIGNRIGGYYKTGGVWSSDDDPAWSSGAVVTDNTISAAGVIAVHFEGGSGSTTDFIDEISGGSASTSLPQDSSGNGNHTTASFGSPAYSQAGSLVSDPGDTSIRCDIGAYFDIASPVMTVTDNWTIEAWMKLGGNSSSNGRTALRNGTTAGYELDVDIDGTFYYYPQGGTQGADSVGKLSTSEWKLVHLIRRNGVVEYWINGTADTIGAGGTAPGTPSGTGKIGAAAGADILFDEIAYYDSALSSERIMAHYLAGIASHSPADDVPIIIHGRGAV